MDYFRDVDKCSEELNDCDRREIFEGILNGSSDFTVEFLERIFCDYSVDNIVVKPRFEHDRNEVRLLVYKGYACPVIHESAIDELDERAMFVCSDEEWAMSDAELIAKLVKDDVIPESDDELTLEQAVKVALGYKHDIGNDDWAKAMAAMQEWIDDEKGLMTEPL